MDSSIINSVTKNNFVVDQYFAVYNNILDKLQTLSEKAKKHLSDKCTSDGRISSKLLNENQYKTHGFAWFETYRISLRETLSWYKRLNDSGQATKLDSLILAGAFSEYLMQMRDGIMMSQSETIRYNELGLDKSDFSFFEDKETFDAVSYGLSEDLKLEIVDYLDKGQYPSLGLGDETLDMIQDQFKKFTDDEILPFAHEWHLKDALIPDDVLSKMSELGVFSLAIPEQYGGLGMGKVAMCVVTEELSRGFLAAGSLGTRAEIAGELIRLGGTEEQKNKIFKNFSDSVNVQK